MADTRIVLGTAFITDKGEWTNGTSYEQNDIVHTADGVYMSLVDNNTAATTDTASWRVFLDKADIHTTVNDAIQRNDDATAAAIKKNDEATEAAITKNNEASATAVANAETATESANTAAAAANTAATTIDDKIATKAEQSDLDATNEAVATKAEQSDLDETNKEVAKKVNKADLFNTLYPTYTLESTSNPAFTVSPKDSIAYTEYMKQVGGYMLFFKGGKAYAAKLNRTNWNKFADGADASSVASKCETMIYMPQCHFYANGKTMRFGGLMDISGHAFASPQWVGAYEMYVDGSGVGHSRPDVSPAHTKTMSDFWSCAQALHKEAGLANYGFHCLINALFQLGYGTLNSQEAVGTGGQTSSWEAWRNVNMGYGRTIGDGSGTAATSMSGQNCVKLFGFEDLWGKLWEFRPGIRFYMDDSTRHAVVYDGNQVSNTATGRDITLGSLLNAGGAYVTEMLLGEYWDMIPTAVGGGSNTYYCDGYWDASGGQLLAVGGYAYDGARCGVSFASSADGFSFSWSSFGARLAFFGSPTLVSGTELVAMASA